MYKKSILSASILVALSHTAYAEEASKFEEVVVSATGVCLRVTTSPVSSLSAIF